MDNYVDELNARIDELYRRVYKNRDVLIAYNLIKKGKSKYQHIFSLPSIINKNMQSGNYKRAAKYYLFANKLMDDVEKNTNKMKKSITNYILKD